MNIFKVAGLLLIITQIAFALITKDVDVIRHFVAGVLTMVVYLFDDMIMEDDDMLP